MSNKLVRRAAAITVLVAFTVVTAATIIIAYGAENETQEKLNIESSTEVETIVEAETETVPEIIIIDTTTEVKPKPSFEKKVTKSFVNARLTPDINDNTNTMVIPRGTEVDVLGVENGWAKVFINNEERYIWSEQLLTAEEWASWSEVPQCAEVPLSADLQRYLWEECQDIGMKYCFALALIDQETGGTFRADLVSKTNDWGITQINKCNHRRYIDKGWITCSQDLLNPYNGIHCGLDFMNQYVQQYGCVERSYAQYNTGKPIQSNKNSRSFMKKYEKWKSILGDI